MYGSTWKMCEHLIFLTASSKHREARRNLRIPREGPHDIIKDVTSLGFRDCFFGSLATRLAQPALWNESEQWILKVNFNFIFRHCIGWDINWLFDCVILYGRTVSSHSSNTKFSLELVGKPSWLWELRASGYCVWELLVLWMHCPPSRMTNDRELHELLPCHA